MLFFIATIWLISVLLIVIFFKGATKKEKNIEYNLRLLRDKKDK